MKPAQFKSVQDWQSRKQSQQKISMLTCYDYTFARLIDQSSVDCILVGDSLGMVMHGFESTLEVSVAMMALHTRAVKKGAPNKFIVGDLPFMSNRKGLKFGMESIEKVMKAGASAVKLEGAEGNLQLVHHAVHSGAPVMGHLGLTPQSIHTLGGYKVQGREERAGKKILEDALALQEAGCFALVLECVPSKLAKEITKALEIPTIGIGAGSACDGQVLVLQDMLGMNLGFSPKFLRQFFDGKNQITNAFNDFHSQVQAATFPAAKESYE